MKSFFFSFVFVFSSIMVLPQTPTYISGVSKDSLVKDIATLYFNPFWDNDFNPIKWKTMKTDGKKFHEQLFLNTFQTGVISSRSRSQKIFITPGDSVFFVTDTLSNNLMQKRIIFKFYGKNAAHYNYGYLSDTNQYPTFSKEDGIMAYKNTLVKIQKEKYEFLEEYKQKYYISDEFLEYAKADILNEYIKRLYYPLLGGSSDLIEMKDIPFGYFDNDQHPTNELSSDYPSAMLYRYIDFHSGTIWEDLDVIYNNIINGFSGKERAYLISALIGRFAEKQLPNYSTQLINIIQKAPEYVKDSLYLDYIDRANMFYSFVNNPFPEEIKLNTFFKEYGKYSAISLNEVLQKYTGKPIFIDFWASWCGPCIEDIENSQEAKAYLEEKGMEYIYIAYNDTENVWKKASERLGITANQYILLSSNKSPIYEYLKIREIPRYIILDANHNIISGKAPHPVPAFFSEFKYIVDKSFKKTIMF